MYVFHFSLSLYNHTVAVAFLVVEQHFLYMVTAVGVFVSFIFFGDIVRTVLILNSICLLFFLLLSELYMFFTPAIAFTCAELMPVRFDLNYSFKNMGYIFKPVRIVYQFLLQ